MLRLGRLDFLHLGYFHWDHYSVLSKCKTVNIIIVPVYYLQIVCRVAKCYVGDCSKPCPVSSQPYVPEVKVRNIDLVYKYIYIYLHHLIRYTEIQHLK